jgi:hypothetical protein
MAHRLLPVLAGLMLFSNSSHLMANPITYDFSGTFDQPVNGTTQFSGSFTFNTDATITYSAQHWPNIYPYMIAESGKDVALVVTIGNQTINYQNTNQYPDLAKLSVYRNPTNYPVEPSGDTIDVGGAPPYSPPGYSPGFGFSLGLPHDEIFSQAGPNGAVSLPNLSAFELRAASYTDSSNVLHEGQITSIQEVSIPEPSMLAVFATLGALAIVHRRFRRSS